ncbi:nucleotidyltransferase family protein [Actinopolymorpha cephalotaxi]|uniref:nucleotidyltransferase family protein n=1 Tax=Actinopolymorpha cephalotaxi TaxID=504797 RepID=UPI002ED319D5
MRAVRRQASRPLRLRRHERFDETASDVDFLVDFRDDVASRFDAYFGLKESLESLLGRPVDLVSPVAPENPYFAASVAGDSHEVYPG